MPRRRRPDPLAVTDQPRWILVQDKLSREVSRRELPPFANLAAELQRESDHWSAEGWTVEMESGGLRYGFFFMNRDGERQQVSLTCSAKPLRNHGEAGAASHVAVSAPLPQHHQDRSRPQTEVPRFRTRTARRLNDYDGEFLISVLCTDCSHERTIPAKSLAKRVGCDARLGEVVKRLRCSACQSRKVETRVVGLPR